MKAGGAAAEEAGTAEGSHILRTVRSRATLMQVVKVPRTMKVGQW